jgi:hypothetical protein
MKFKVNPYIGAEPIIFGMTSDQIESVIGVKARKFKKSPYSETLTDAFEYFHVYYKSNGECEAIEFFQFADLVFNGDYLIGKPYQEVESLFKSIDNRIEINDCGFTSYKFGIGIYAPFSEEEPNEPVEGVIVFEKGYYD